jgi:hypothetical protein
VLIQRRRAHLDQPLVRPRLRRAHFEHLALHAQLIARPHRARPAQFVEPCPDHATSGFEIALDEEPHRGCGRMPAARCEAAEHSAARGRLVEVKRLRIEFRGESHDPILLDPNPRGAAESLSGLEIFQIASGHSSTSLTIR